MNIAFSSETDRTYFAAEAAARQLGAGLSISEFWPAELRRIDDVIFLAGGMLSSVGPRDRLVIDLLRQGGLGSLILGSRLAGQASISTAVADSLVSSVLDRLDSQTLYGVGGASLGQCIEGLAPREGGRLLREIDQRALPASISAVWCGALAERWPWEAVAVLLGTLGDSSNSGDFFEIIDALGTVAITHRGPALRGILNIAGRIGPSEQYWAAVRLGLSPQLADQIATLPEANAANPAWRAVATGMLPTFEAATTDEACRRFIAFAQDDPDLTFVVAMVVTNLWEWDSEALVQERLDDLLDLAKRNLADTSDLNLRLALSTLETVRPASTRAAFAATWEAFAAALIDLDLERRRDIIREQFGLTDIDSESPPNPTQAQMIRLMEEKAAETRAIALEQFRQGGSQIDQASTQFMQRQIALAHRSLLAVRGMAKSVPAFLMGETEQNGRGSWDDDSGWEAFNQTEERINAELRELLLDPSRTDIDRIQWLAAQWGRLQRLKPHVYTDDPDKLPPPRERIYPRRRLPDEVTVDRGYSVAVTDISSLAEDPKTLKVADQAAMQLAAEYPLEAQTILLDYSLRRMVFMSPMEAQFDGGKAVREALLRLAKTFPSAFQALLLDQSSSSSSDAAILFAIPEPLIRRHVVEALRQFGLHHGHMAEVIQCIRGFMVDPTPFIRNLATDALRDLALYYGRDVPDFELPDTELTRDFAFDDTEHSADDWDETTHKTSERQEVHAKTTDTSTSDAPPMTISDAIQAAWWPMIEAESPATLMRSLFSFQFKIGLDNAPAETQELLSVASLSPTRSVIEKVRTLLSEIESHFENASTGYGQLFHLFCGIDIAACDLLTGDFEQFNAGIASAFGRSLKSGDATFIIAVVDIAWPLLWYRLRMTAVSSDRELSSLNHRIAFQIRRHPPRDQESVRAFFYAETAFQIANVYLLAAKHDIEEQELAPLILHSTTFVEGAKSLASLLDSHFDRWQFSEVLRRFASRIPERQDW